MQGELAPLLDRHLADAEARRVELREFAARLQRARDQLAAIERDGPCDPSCAFLGRDQHPGPALLTLPRAAAEDGPAIACTLAASERLEQADRWRAMLTAVTTRSALPDGLRLAFDPGRVRLGELAELAGDEARCCRFFEISLHLTDPPAMDVRAPADALPLVHELFGEPDA